MKKKGQKVGKTKRKSHKNEEKCKKKRFFEKKVGDFEEIILQNENPSYLCTRNQQTTTCSKKIKTKKSEKNKFFLRFFEKKFGGIKKSSYLCSRFRSERKKRKKLNCN